MTSSTISVLFKSLSLNALFKNQQQKISVFRSYATVKRFYRKTNVLKSDGKYEISLDQRKLKTPKGNIFSVESEPLALAVATEWDSQNDKIIRSKMHITTLCNTVLDNPNNHTKFDLANYVTNYLDTDTILFQTNEDADLYEFQANQWDPIIEWFNKRYKTTIQKSVEMLGPSVTQKDKDLINRHLMSYNFNSLYGFVYSVDTIKSVILTMACVEHFISVEKAVLLSRLEEEYQLRHWGRVEWAHDLNQQDLQARLSAVVLFIHCNNQSAKIQTKNT